MHSLRYPQAVLKVRKAVVHVARMAVAAAAIASAGGCATHAAMELDSETSTRGESAVDVVTYYLPKQLVAIDLERRVTATPKDAAMAFAPASYEDTLTLRLLPPIPDVKRRFVARLRRATRRGEAFATQTTEAGLLTSVGVLARDRTGEVLDRIISSAAAPRVMLAGQARTAISVVPATCLASYEAASAAPVQSLKTTVIFDPTDSADLERAESQLDSLGAHYRLELERVGPSHTRVVSSAPDDDLEPRLAAAGGLFYRRPQPYVLSIYRFAPSSADETQFVSATQVSLANEAPIERASLSAGALKSYERAQFQEGTLGVRPAPMIAGVSADAWNALLPKRPHLRIKFSTGNEPGGTSDPAESPDPQVEIVKAVLALKKAEEEQRKGR